MPVFRFAPPLVPERFNAGPTAPQQQQRLLAGSSQGLPASSLTALDPSAVPMDPFPFVPEFPAAPQGQPVLAGSSQGLAASASLTAHEAAPQQLGRLVVPKQASVPMFQQALSSGSANASNASASVLGKRRRDVNDSASRTLPASRGIRPRAQTALSMGIDVQQTERGLRLEVQRANNGSGSGACMNNLFQCSLLKHEDLAQGGFSELVDNLKGIGGAPVKFLDGRLGHIEAGKWRELLETLPKVGAAVAWLDHARVDDLGSPRHLLALTHVGARAGTKDHPSGIWAVLDAGRPEFEVPAVIYLAEELQDALSYLAERNASQLSLVYPTSPLRAPLESEGAYLPGHGYMTYRDMTAAQLTLVASMNEDPVILEGPSDAVPAAISLDDVPRKCRESNDSYAVRLHEYASAGVQSLHVNGKPCSPFLLAEMTNASMAVLLQDENLLAAASSDLRQLQKVKSGCPRQQTELPDMYARRLHQRSQGGEEGALVDQAPLLRAHISWLTGVSLKSLRGPLFERWTQQDKAVLSDILATWPRSSREDDVSYARRLYVKSLAPYSLARVGGQPLRPRHLELLSGTSQLLHCGANLAPTEEERRSLVSVFTKLPQLSDESPLQYGYRLKRAWEAEDERARIDGQRLTSRHISLLTGLPQEVVALNKLGWAAPEEADLQPVALQIKPRDDESNESYAVRLFRLSEVGYPKAQVRGKPMSVEEVSALSGLSPDEVKGLLKLSPAALEDLLTSLQSDSFEDSDVEPH